MTIKNSFSIENILSKPHKNLKIDSLGKTESVTECSEKTDSVDKVPSFASNDIVLKEEPINGLINDEQLNTHDDFANNNNRNHFTSPDSSGCEEDNGDNLSDITSGENRMCTN